MDESFEIGCEVKLTSQILLMPSRKW